MGEIPCRWFEPKPESSMVVVSVACCLTIFEVAIGTVAIGRAREDAVYAQLISKSPERCDDNDGYVEDGLVCTEQPAGFCRHFNRFISYGLLQPSKHRFPF